MSIQSTDSSIVEECGTCRANLGGFPTPGGVIYQDGQWRLEHTFEPIPMVGWLVLKPLRHVEFFGDLTAEEARTFGPLVQRITSAMREVHKPAKVYLCQFAEQEGFGHLHFHLIPRAAELPRELRGPHVFDLMAEALRERRNLGDLEEAAQVATAVRERLAMQVRGA
jgi:diadenosine tetraphosphate (Ap4A) HIT family hydrolase